MRTRAEHLDSDEPTGSEHPSSEKLGRTGEPALERRIPLRPTSPRRFYLLSLPVVALATGIGVVLYPHLAPTNIAMIYLLGVAFVAVRFGRGPSMLASVLSVLALNFFFVPPRFTFAVWDSQYLLTFAVMLGVGTLISTLAGRLRSQVKSSRVREQRIASLYALSREFSKTSGIESVVRLAEQFIGDMLGADVWVLLRSASGALDPAPGITSAFALRAEERAVAQWALEHGSIAGRGTMTLPGSQGLYVPLSASRGPIGVLGLFLGDGALPDQDRMRLVEALAGQTALVLERSVLARDAQRARFQAESERLRDALLSSVSHDLRTPLGTITGAASTLAEPGAPLSEAARRDLAQSICEESERLNRLVSNLLSMTRLQSGAVPLHKEWHPIDEVIGAALTRLRTLLRDRAVQIRLPEDLPMVPLDDVLVEQVLVNLIENAVKHTPEGTPIEIGAAVRGDRVFVEVADSGPGIPAGSEERIFAKFTTRWDQSGGVGVGPGANKGVGLGLTICKGFIEAHGGSITAENRPGGGALFRFALPIGQDPPPLPPEEEEEKDEGQAQRDGDEEERAS